MIFDIIAWTCISIVGSFSLISCGLLLVRAQSTLLIRRARFRLASEKMEEAFARATVEIAREAEAEDRKQEETRAVRADQLAARKKKRKQAREARRKNRK